MAKNIPGVRWDATSTIRRTAVLLVSASILTTVYAVAQQKPETPPVGLEVGRYLLAERAESKESAGLYRIDTLTGTVWKLEEGDVWLKEDFEKNFPGTSYDTFLKKNLIPFKEPHWKKISEYPVSVIVKEKPFGN